MEQERTLTNMDYTNKLTNINIHMSEDKAEEREFPSVTKLREFFNSLNIPDTPKGEEEICK